MCFIMDMKAIAIITIITAIKKRERDFMCSLGLELILAPPALKVHDVEFAPDIDIVVNETLPALAHARKLGKIRFIGVTGACVVYIYIYIYVCVCVLLDV